jgi:hypothetical protein
LNLKANDIAYFAAKVNNFFMDDKITIKSSDALEASEIIKMAQEVFKAFSFEEENEENGDGSELSGDDASKS